MVAREDVKDEGERGRTGLVDTWPAPRLPAGGVWVSGAGEDVSRRCVSVWPLPVAALTKLLPWDSVVCDGKGGERESVFFGWGGVLEVTAKKHRDAP